MDEQNGHRHFSVSCFNGVWSYLEKPDRTRGEDDLMREMAHASLYHWFKRDDCEDWKKSIGFWQLSRVYAVLNNGAEARYYAERCLEVSSGLPPYYIGYGHEALARASKILGERVECQNQLMLAQDACGKVSEEQDRKLLAADLEALSSSLLDLS
jgi:hypothetical protein